MSPEQLEREKKIAAANALLKKVVNHGPVWQKMQKDNVQDGMYIFHTTYVTENKTDGIDTLWVDTQTPRILLVSASYGRVRSKAAGVNEIITDVSPRDYGILVFHQHPWRPDRSLIINGFSFESLVFEKKDTLKGMICDLYREPGMESQYWIFKGIPVKRTYINSTGGYPRVDKVLVKFVPNAPFPEWRLVNFVPSNAVPAEDYRRPNPHRQPPPPPGGSGKPKL